jgi:hypothetical protein
MIPYILQINIQILVPLRYAPELQNLVFHNVLAFQDFHVTIRLPGP